MERENTENAERTENPHHDRIARMTGNRIDKIDTGDLEKSTFREYFTSRIWTTADRHTSILSFLGAQCLNYLVKPLHFVLYHLYKSSDRLLKPAW